MGESDRHATSGVTPTEAGIARWLTSRIARFANVADAEVDPTAPFSSFGVDSLAAAELMADLETELD
ncbi:MAG: acyl carrier protein, partial [Microthrixaceae bacterium]|nr:acyl carrier protein [Microthrixaceae bacterium]